MMRVHVETGTPLEVRTKVRIAIQGLFTTVFFATLALIAGCSGVVSHNSSSNPPPQAQTYSVSGTISPTSGGGGATVNLSGATAATTTANSSGGYIFTGLANGTYAVTPNHAGYIFSPTSQAATVTGANVTGINFTAAVAQAHTATASWTASASVVSGYNVYRGTLSGGPYTRLNGSLISLLTYTDATVLSGQTYFFVTTAVDGSGTESVFSNEVRAIIP
jgi:uncharacterized protein YceK